MKKEPSVNQRAGRIGDGGGIEIRGMTDRDLDAVLEIEKASYPVPWRRGMFEAELREKDRSRLWVARDGASGRLAGYVCFWLLFDEIHLLNVTVGPEFRNRGVGRELIRRTLEYGRENGARKANLEVRASNPAALRLYEGFGFEAVGVRPRYYRAPPEDGLVMVLEDLNANHRGGIMMGDEQKVREELIRENFEFRKLHNEHLNLDNQVREMTKRKIRTPEEELHRKQLQVEKLKAKDRMEDILRAHRRAETPSR
jgi:[ribosomal protein S18]-alanine N-acetyltransferase